jgi:hypothetical protein
MADSAGPFYVALSQSLEAHNPVASYVTLYYAVQCLLQRNEQVPGDTGARAQINTAFVQLEAKKQQLGPLPGCKGQYEDFLRQMRASGNQNYTHCLRALSLFGEIGPEWQTQPQPPADLSRSAPGQPNARDQSQQSALARSNPGVSLSGSQLQVLEQAKEQILDAIQEFEFKKVAEGRARLEAALRMLTQLG